MMAIGLRSPSSHDAVKQAMARNGRMGGRGDVGPTIIGPLVYLSGAAGSRGSTNWVCGMIAASLPSDGSGRTQCTRLRFRLTVTEGRAAGGKEIRSLSLPCRLMIAEEKGLQVDPARAGTAASDRDLFGRSLHGCARAEMRHHQLAHHPILLDHLVLRGRQRWRQVDVLHAGVALFEALQVGDEVVGRAGEPDPELSKRV